MIVHSMRFKCDSGGAGRRRGAPGLVTEYGSRFGPMSVAYMFDGFDPPARGVRGGKQGSGTVGFLIDEDGAELPLRDRMAQLVITVGQRLRTDGGGGGGHGSPFLREPELVLRDVRDQLVSRQAARTLYGVVITEASSPSEMGIDMPATLHLRASGADLAGKE
jgi:N-methylhydantoinase B